MILFLIPGHRGGGAEKVCLELANEFVVRGVDLEVWSIYLIGKSTYKNVEIQGAGKRRLIYSWGKIREIIVKKSPKTVVCFDNDLASMIVLLRLLKIVSGFKLISRNINTQSALRNNRYTLVGQLKGYFMDNLYPKVDIVINQCSGMQMDLLILYPELKEKSVFIYNPVNLKDFKFKVVEKKQIIFACVGRLVPQKNFHEAITAFERFNKIYPSSILRIFGNGPLRATLAEYVETLNLTNNVFFEGYIDDVSQIYQNLTGLLLTSQYEGFPNVMIEALASGIPVISFDFKSGPSEVIVNGINGFLVDNRSIDLLAQRMIQLVQNPLNDLSIRESVHRMGIGTIADEYFKLF